MATDIWKPPGVTMRRKGALPAMRSMAASNAFSAGKARPRSSTAPSCSACFSSKSNRSGITASIWRLKLEFQSAGGAPEDEGAPMFPPSINQAMEKTMANTIRYAAGQSSLGPFVAALSERGLAMVEFGEMHEADLRGRFPGANLVEDPEALQATLGWLGELVEHPESEGNFALDLRGSAFE